MTFSADELDRLHQWNERLQTDLEIRFQRTDDPRSVALESFLDELWKEASHVRVVIGDTETALLPRISIRENLHYQAIPVGLELKPLLDLLLASLDENEQSAFKSSEDSVAVEWPAQVQVFIAPQCPHCPQVVYRIAHLALQNPMIQVTVVDGTLFPELAEKEGIRSAPTILLDETFRWTGVPPMDEFLQALRGRDPSLLSAESLKQMLKDGQAGRLAAMMLEQRRVFPGLLELIDHPEWSVRIGAVVVVEELAEKDPELARSCLEPIWERAAELDRSATGDLIYLSGLVGTADWVPRLEAFRPEDPDDELREVLDEALDAIRSRSE